ncbi:MAG: hypothetical protein HYX43_08650 [Burkholderiales bacterium]|nr:hypothetical protein [Burkholderiales bacterium]
MCAFSYPSRVIRLIGLCLALAGTSAQADGGLRLSGFGTVGYTADNRSDIAPARDIAQQPDSGFSTGPSWKVDSRLGVQVEYSLSSSADLVGQLVVRDQFHRTLDSATELAYLTVRPGAQWDVRAGRINYDAFLMSEYRNVGYAYPWVRPPSEFYGWIPILSVDGLDATYGFETEAARWRLKAQLGRSSPLAIPIQSGYDLRVDDLQGLSLTGQTDKWRYKLAYSQMTVGNEVPAFAPLHAGWHWLRRRHPGGRFGQGRSAPQGVNVA